MRIDNSKWGSTDYLDKLIKMVSSKQKSESDVARLLGKRIKKIEKSGQSIKSLHQALQEQMRQTNKSMISASSLTKANHNTIEGIIRNMR